MPKLMFLTPELPWPARSGGKLKSLKLLEALAEEHQVTLVSPLKLEDAKHLPAFQAAFPHVRHIYKGVNIGRNASNLLKSYIAGEPLNVFRTFDVELSNKVEEIAEHFDVIFIDHYEVHKYVPSRYQGMKIYHAHNTYHQIWMRYAKVSHLPWFKCAAWLEGKRVKQCEEQVALFSDLVFAAPNDLELLQQAGVDPTKLNVTYHLGDEKQLVMPDLQFAETGKKLLYIGFLGWEPNSQGIMWFIDKVWPLLKASFPDLELDIVGKGADQALLDIVARNSGIRVCGYVDDLETVYRSSRVSIAPLLFGSGMKVKVLDAMARGLPVATTPVGAEGIDARGEEVLKVATEPEQMAEQITILLEDKTVWEALRDNARTLIRETYNWDYVRNSMHSAISAKLNAKDESQYSSIASPDFVYGTCNLVP